MHRQAYLLLVADDAVLGRQRDRRQAGTRPYLADAADRCALGHCRRHPRLSRADSASPPTGRRSAPGCRFSSASASSASRSSTSRSIRALKYTSAINVSIEQAGMPMLIFIVNFLLFGLRATRRADRRLPALDRRRRTDGKPWRAATPAAARGQFRRRADAASASSSTAATRWRCATSPMCTGKA